MGKMTFKMALDNLCANYPYCMPRNDYKRVLQSGIDRGLSVRAAYNGIKLICAIHTGSRELFTIDDVMEMTRASKQEVFERIEELKREMIARGENPDSAFIPVEKVQTFQTVFKL